MKKVIEIRVSVTSENAQPVHHIETFGIKDAEEKHEKLVLTQNGKERQIDKERLKLEPLVVRTHQGWIATAWSWEEYAEERKKHIYHALSRRIASYIKEQQKVVAHINTLVETDEIGKVDSPAEGSLSYDLEELAKSAADKKTSQLLKTSADHIHNLETAAWQIQKAHTANDSHLLKQALHMLETLGITAGNDQ